MGNHTPSYIALHERGELTKRAAIARDWLEECTMCPRRCKARRLDGVQGDCGLADTALLCSAHPHFGEERPLVGSHGSGTIFFAGCNLHCMFCQNYDLSMLKEGRSIESADLAMHMLNLEKMGCHNINLVSPTHVLPMILEALVIAVDQGLSKPLVYNTGGYDTVESLKILDGVVDIYMPDMKFADGEIAELLAQAPDYPEANRAAVREMHRQVGDLVVDDHGVAQRGLLVRHLVLPGGLAGTESICGFLATEISKDTYINIMDQYRPCYRADRYQPINRRITDEEYQAALQAARHWGLWRLDDRRFAFRVVG